MLWFLVLSMALMGAVLGSFANVVIWRFPRGESLARPPSHCPACGHRVRWYDNVPIASWLLLHGRCRDCGSRISLRYPVVELLSAVLWAAAALAFGYSATTLSATVFFYGLLILSFIDLDTMRLPNPLVALLAAYGVVAVLLAELTDLPLGPLVAGAERGLLASPLGGAVSGVLLGGGLSLATASAYRAVRGRSGFGMGDVKLLATMGLFLGPYVLMALFLGSFAGVVGGTLQVRGQRAKDDSDGRRTRGESQRVPDIDRPPLSQSKFPFGPYLALGGVVAALTGPQLWQAYVSLLVPA